jgi:hypothetical protein
MTVIHYFLIGLSLLAAGLVVLLRNRILAIKPQLARLMGSQKVNVDQRLNVNSAIPQQCMLCHRLGDCMVATVYVKKISER